MPMSRPGHHSLQPTGPRRHPRLRRSQEFALALLPTSIVLIVFYFVEIFSRQRLLFASLASSAFLICLDPEHSTNSARTLVLSQMLAALLGMGMAGMSGPGYPAAGIAMVVSIALMILLDALHPPAVATALAFAFRSGPESNLLLFTFAVGLIVVLVGLQRATVWTLTHVTDRR